MEDEIIYNAKIIKENGGNLYLVGGALRDEILGEKVEDLDFCVTGMTQEFFLKLFKKARVIGKEFPVFLLNGNEYALARKDFKIASGYKGFEVYTSRDLKIEEDLKRRDITMNAIARDVLTGEIIDPFGGVEDIKNRRIKHVSDSFCEDPLRVYRVARFAAKYNFKVDLETLELIKKLRGELYTLKVERVEKELEKALSSPKPSIFFKVLKEANLLDIHFRQIYNLINVRQPKIYHPEGDVFNHTMLVIDEVAKNTKDISVIYAALLHDLGKALTKKDKLPHHIGHDITGVELVIEISNKLKVPNKFKNRAIEVCKYHMRAGKCLDMRPYKLASFFYMLNKTSIGISNMEMIIQADDMLKRPNTKFSKLAKDTLGSFNGKMLIENGITIEKVGKERFLNEILIKQAEFIKSNKALY